MSFLEPYFSTNSEYKIGLSKTYILLFILKYAGTTGISKPFLNAVSQINKNPLCNPSSLDKYPLVESSGKIATELSDYVTSGEMTWQVPHSHGDTHHLISLLLQHEAYR